MFPIALEEIKNGRKRSHWMWYIFPQIRGLGMSSTSRFYAIKDTEEARAFLHDPYLGGNLMEICGVLLSLEENDARRIFGSPDDIKLRSSMTLFGAVSESGSVFHRILEKYFDGIPDELTLDILRSR